MARNDTGEMNFMKWPNPAENRALDGAWRDNGISIYLSMRSVAPLITNAS